MREIVWGRAYCKVGVYDTMYAALGSYLVKVLGMVLNLPGVSFSNAYAVPIQRHMGNETNR